jgi:hypothetical protein
MRLAGACLLILFAGCGVGDDSDLDPPIEPIDPNPNRMVCSEGFTVRGTWAAGTPARPLDEPTGCWPVGTWTFTATIDPQYEAADLDGDAVGERCGQVPGTSAPTLEPSYSFTVNRVDNGDGWEESYIFNGEEARLFRIKVSEGGAKECEGQLELLSPDDKQLWSFKPNQGVALDDNGNPVPGSATELIGSGEYIVFLDSQRIP